MALSLSSAGLLAAVALGLTVFLYGITPQLRFIWYCFLRPIGGVDQKTRLEKFYKGQAEVYDATRHGLLRGRKTMLKLSAAHIRVLQKSTRKSRLIWVDIGGGTGHNIELMDKYFPIAEFDHVYLVDLCEPLLQIARERFEKRGWKNVTVLCQDATSLYLPEWSHKGIDPKGSVDFVTLSYSLSMIPDFYTLLDRIDYMVSPQDGLIAVVDFYTAGKQPSLHEKAIGGVSKECGWLSRWFWQIWFDFDHVDLFFFTFWCPVIHPSQVSLTPARRAYLEYKFGTIKSYNGRNRFVLPLIIRIPYYIWLGRPRSCDLTVSRSCHAFEVDGGNMIGNCSPEGPFTIVKEAEVVPPLEIGESELDMTLQLLAKRPGRGVAIDVTPPLSSFHYHITSPWRLPYYEHDTHKLFRTFLYSFTWEDPLVDMEHLDLTSEDSMFIITSAGDNALHYALAASPARIHSVDLNPCQGHLMELKLAAIQSLDYDTFFALFGLGKYPDFRCLLDSTIAPYLSSAAYQFWRINEHYFSAKSSFYLQGYSGWALALGKLVFSLAGITGHVRSMCECDSLEEQGRIWREKIRPVLLNPVVVALLRSKLFCWNALGVPSDQRNMVLEGGGVYEYICETFDPLAEKYLFKNDNYFYLLALLGHYSPASCPGYLTRQGFEALKANNGKALDAFRLHTDSIVNVLRNLSPGSLTRSLLMDHLDWFTPDAPEKVQEEVNELHRALAQGGMIFWRSASKRPWYNDLFEVAGFKLTRLGLREGSAIDRVNMYASFWRAVKV
ncbi:hypothetical protein C8J56DRAFT_927718 [Mycena floridula]|nr:hypothetical protein C8J56DRAFT_927718 [Mycena floridula]